MASSKAVTDNAAWTPVGWPSSLGATRTTGLGPGGGPGASIATGSAWVAAVPSGAGEDGGLVDSCTRCRREQRRAQAEDGGEAQAGDHHGPGVTVVDTSTVPR